MVPVIVLNSDAHRMAGWLATACVDAGAAHPRHCAQNLAIRVLCQSGNQFPVAGFVAEGPLYVITDGVTVAIAELGSKTNLSRAPTQAEAEAALTTSRVTRVGSYARVQGTTREEYAGFVDKPASSFNGAAWQAEILRAYQAAWSSNRNTLMSAWARANRSLVDNLGKPGSRFDKDCQKAVWQHCAYSDDVAQSFRLDVAHRSDLMSPSVPG